jgi:formate dehydrogenase-N alpha subunit
VAGLGPTYGRGAMTNDWVDVKNSDAILVIGANPAENHPASMAWVNAARDKNQAKLIVVDPRSTRTAATADLYVRLRSGTDIVFLGGLINYVMENKLYNEEYVKYYTNALTLVSPDFQDAGDLDGLFSGYDGEKRAYDTKTWQYQTEKQTVTVKQKDPVSGAEQDVEKEVTVVKQAETLDDPNCVFALLKKHYSRYTPETVEKICGTPQADFLKVAEAYCRATSTPDKTGSIFYAMGQTQHTVGTQNVRSIAMLQLLLGNIGVPGGGVNALRGESNVQGSTDMALLYHDLPGYLGAPSEKDVDFATYIKRFSSTSYWSNGPAFFKTLMKAWYGNAAAAENSYAYDYLPKYSVDCSWISLFEAMYAGKIKGLFCMGQNPAIGGPNARFERKALENLDWLVVMDLFETETASFWRGPEADTASINTEVFLLPAVDAVEKAGSIATSGRRLQWRPQVAAAPGEAKPDMSILTLFVNALKEAYKTSTDAKDRPILDLVWDYGDPPDVELVAREINGYAVDDVKDATGKVLVKKGDPLDAFAKIASAADPLTIACGCWIYSGYFYPTDDGNGTQMPAVKRRGQKDPGDMGFYPYWGFTWPANRRILYNRASTKPDGTPWADNKKAIWWDPNADSGTKDAQGNPVLGKWVGYDVPDFPATKAPTAKADPAKTGLGAQSGTDAFIMQADGKGRLFAPTGCKEGPLPEHYESVESPTKNLMSSTQINPVVKLWNTDAGNGIGDGIGTADKFPIICTTYRVTEMWQTGTMSRTIPWLAELQPNMFLELGKELAAEKGIENGDQVIVTSARGEIQMVALVTARWRPFLVNGQKVHEVGMPWHYGWQGLATGAAANDLTPHVGDGNTMIPEYKSFLVDVRKA